MCRKTVGLLGMMVGIVLGIGLGAGVALAQERVDSSTTDHSKLESLMRDFASGPEVTAACLSCHTEAGEQVMPRR
jgi:cytochrome c2